MAQPDPFAAQLLENGVGGFAGYASSLLLERHPHVLDGEVTVRDWRGHMAQRVLELAAAVRTGEPDIFVARARWIRAAAQAREQSDEGLLAGFQCLHEILQERLPAPAARSVEPHLAAALHTFEEPLTDEQSEVDAETPIGRLALRYLEKALEGDARQAIAVVLDAVDAGLSTRDAYLKVLMGAQREVGRLWHQGELGISEEHLVTATTKRAMSILCHRGTAAPPVGKTVVTAAVAGNIHEVGIRLASDFFELAGWRSICLMPSVPAHEIQVAIGYFDADLLVLAATMATQLKAVADTIELIRGGEGPRIPVIVGGPAFLDGPRVWQRVGADALAEDPEQAVAIGSKLVATAS